MEKLSNFINENIRLLLGAAVVVFVTVLLITLLISGKSTKVLVNDQTFKVIVAKSDKDKQIGLSEKNKIEQDQGMLFIFDNPQYHSFWMKDMKFPIDIIYINGDKVTTVIDSARPPGSIGGNLETYQPLYKSDKVLEVNAGIANKYNIKSGTLVKIENL